MTDPHERNETPEGDHRRSRAAAHFSKTLDKHGYGFHYAVIRRAQELSETQSSHWVFEAAEFPVQVRQHPTRIDLLLRHARANVLLVGECKRANPAVANWCFARAPFSRRNLDAGREPMILDGFRRIGDTDAVVAHRHRAVASLEVYHIGLEVDTGDAGDSRGTKEGIEAAVSQVLKGTNGFVEYARDSPHVWRAGERFLLLPVVFTTASLWVSEVNLAEARLATGELAPADAGFRAVTWLAYQYNTSPGLLHSKSNSHGATSLSDALAEQFTRTVAIVSPDGVDAFLRWSSEMLY